MAPAPATEIAHAWDGHSVWRHKSPLADGLYRIRIPAHTSAWPTGITTWKPNEPASALLRMDEPPGAGPIKPVGALHDTLARLLAGETLSAHAIGNAQTLSIASGGGVPVDSGPHDRWLYLQISFPHGAAMDFQSLIVAPGPDAPAPGPDALQSRTLAYAHNAGLIEPLMRLSAAASEHDLVERVQDSGTWAALMRMVQLIETSK